jgi:hypothetical protein
MVLREFADSATIVLQGLHRTWPALRAFIRRFTDELVGCQKSACGVSWRDGRLQP